MNRDFLSKAAALRPRLRKTRVFPVSGVTPVKDPASFQGIRMEKDPVPVPGRILSCGDSLILDFGRHIAGRVRLLFEATGVHQDSPLVLSLTFGEMPCELLSYDPRSQLSSTWIGPREAVIDCVEKAYLHPRREAFRYLKIEVKGSQMHWKPRLLSAVAIAETSAGKELPVRFADPELAKIDRVGVATLRDCMQTVFEDGPKRDRRLWLGDLHLEAKANYLTFDNRALVRRCLYLFAGLPLEDGRMSCCIFEEPVPANDEWCLWDYALFFITTLEDYYNATGDRETLSELWPTARTQAELVLARMDEGGCFSDLNVFADWQKRLDKTVCRHAIAIYGLRSAARLGRILSDEREKAYTAAAEKIGGACRRCFYDASLGLYVSGPDRQISFASQVWMCLSGELTSPEAKQVLTRVADFPGAIPMMTPYMHHYYTEALIYAGLRREALTHIRSYWGKMVQKGADCFFEAFDPGNDDFSPYGRREMNSYCHAWSCTAAYFLRKYFRE